MTSARIVHIATDFDLSDLSDPAWDNADPVVVNRYWSGAAAGDERAFRACLLWSVGWLYVLFDAVQSEPLVLADGPDLASKTMGLWQRDVCEIFIAPHSDFPNKYFEFEVAPTGEWLDLAIDVRGGERITDWEYTSGMRSAARICDRRIAMAIAIPFKSLGKGPVPGDVWLGNLFRCVGSAPSRGYLAWQPTMTPQPNFHVPERFGKFLFV